MRIAIVNDMLMATEALRRVIAGSPEHEIAWTARDGAEAVAKCARDTPDLILMDLIMPVMDGVEATRRITAESPCAILIVTATVEGNAAMVFEAMGHGALDAVNTPALGAPEGAAAMSEKIALIGKLVRAAPASEPAARQAHRAAQREPEADSPRLVVIGSSTGGPKALATILSALPASFPAAVVVIQHVDARFAAALAGWLDTQTPLSVRLAPEGGRARAGSVLIPATDDHLVMALDGALTYTPTPRDYPYRPSVNAFFESVARNWPRACVAVILTGMGRDGAQGLLALRRAGWRTIAQDEASCIVYGMPKAAADIGAAQEILPLDRIAPALLDLVEKA